MGIDKYTILSSSSCSYSSHSFIVANAKYSVGSLPVEWRTAEDLEVSLQSGWIMKVLNLPSFCSSGSSALPRLFANSHLFIYTSHFQFNKHFRLASSNELMELHPNSLCEKTRSLPVLIRRLYVLVPHEHDEVVECYFRVHNLTVKKPIPVFKISN